MKLRFLLPAMLVFVGCQSSDSIVIGSAGPWKAGYGNMNRLGIELAVEEINARGGVRGKPVSVVLRDDDGAGVTAAAIAQEFVQNRDIVAVVGHVNSGAMVAAAKVYHGHLTAVSTTATSPDITGISPWVFRVISSDSTNGIDLARFAMRLGHRRVAILYENNSYGRGLADAFQRNFRGEVMSNDPIADDQVNFEPYVAYFRLREPQLVFVASTEAAGIAFLREARRQGLNADFLGGDGWLGIVAAAEAAQGAYVGAPFSAADPRPEAQRFVNAFRARYGQMPDGNAALGYDATMLVAEAIASAGTDRAGVRRYLAGITPQQPFRGVTGAISFGPGGDPVGKSFVMVRVQGSELVVQGTGR